MAFIPLTLGLAGCARFPGTPPVVEIPARTLLSQITVAGEINPTYYYFLALDLDGNPATGPIPVITGPELGNGWGTLSGLGPNDPVLEPPFYVEYHNGQFQSYRNGQPIGPPYRGEVSQDGKSLVVEIDQADLGSPIPAVVQLNWITDETITTQPQNPGIAKEYDGIGPTGNDYLDTVPLDITWVRESGVNGVPTEEPSDTTSIADIDLISWRVEVRIRAAAFAP